MKRTLVGVVTGSLVLSMLAVPCVFAQTLGQAVQTAEIKPAMAMEKGERKEHHLEIHKAIRKLKTAREDLEKAAHDYAGHRVKAIEAIDQALAELKLALESDKK